MYGIRSYCQLRTGDPRNLVPIPIPKKYAKMVLMLCSSVARPHYLVAQVLTGSVVF